MGTTRKVLLGLAVGITTGFAVGLLLAPGRGRDTFSSLKKGYYRANKNLDESVRRMKKDFDKEADRTIRTIETKRDELEKLLKEKTSRLANAVA